MIYRSNCLSLLAALVVALTTANLAQATRIGINFHAAEDGGNGTIESGPAGVVPQQNWNNTEGEVGTIAAGSVLQDAGPAVAGGVAVDWWSFAQSGHGGLMDGSEDGHQELFGGSLDPRNGSTVTGTALGDTDSAVIQVTGLDAPYTSGGYSLYVYFDGNSGTETRVAHLRLDPNGDADLADAQDLYGIDRAGQHFIDTQTYAQATSTTDPGIGGLSPSQNYAVIDGLTSSTFILESVPDASASNANVLRSNLMGFQIVANIPEPTSLLLVMTAGLGTVVWRRR